MARLCCKPIGLVNLRLHVADVSWFIQCLLASVPDSSCCTWPYVPALFSSPTSNNNCFHLLRSSVIITTLASIIGVHKGFRQPTFKGAVEHDMTEIHTPESSSYSGVYQFFGFGFTCCFRQRDKSGSRVQDGHAERKTWDMD
jgi:hypothetical protein